MTMTDDRPDAPAPSAASSRANGIAARLAAVVSPCSAASCPCGSGPGTAAWPAPPTPRPSWCNDPAALRRLVFRPGELGLAQAYVTGEIDVEGDLLDGFRRVWQAVRERGASPTAHRRHRAGRAAHRQGPRRLRAAARAAGVAGPAARPAALADPRPGRDLAPLRPVQRLLRADPRPAHGLLLRLLHQRPRRPGVHRRGRPARQARPGLPQARPARGEPGHRHLDIGCGWGSLSLYAAETYGVAGRRRDHRRASRRRSSTRGSPSGARRTGSRSGCRTTATCRTAPSTPSPRSRWASTSASGTTPSYTGRHPPAARGPAAAR